MSYTFNQPLSRVIKLHECDSSCTCGIALAVCPLTVSGSALVPTPQGQQETGLGTPGTTGAKYHFTPVLFCQLWDETFFQKYFLQSELLSYAKTVKKTLLPEALFAQL